MIEGVAKVVVPVEDQAAAKEFWTARVDFEVAIDAPYGDGERWIELSSPAGQPTLVLSSRPAGEPNHEASDALPDSPVFFACDDIQRTYRELTRRNVRFPQPPVKVAFGWWAMFADNEGTRYALGQWE